MTKKPKNKKATMVEYLLGDIQNLGIEFSEHLTSDVVPTSQRFLTNAFGEESITISDFECSATDLLELSSIVESIVSSQHGA